MRFCVLLCAAVWAAVLAGSARARPEGGSPVALVTAETQNEVLAVSLPGGKILRRVHLPSDPENIAVNVQGPSVAVSARGRAVTLLAWRSLRVLRIIRGFGDPHLAAIAPGGRWAYVTDDGTGLLSVIGLGSHLVVRRVFVGIGAHHLSFSPDGSLLWVALGEHARTIVVVDTSRLDRPRVVGRFDPGFPAHDLAFSPDGRRVWVTSDSGSRVRVLSSASRRQLFTVPVGPAPQHVTFGQVTHDAYLTSGYGSRIVMADPRTGRVIRRAHVPYGSFNITAFGGFLATSSLLRGTLTELDGQLRIVRNVRVAPAARDVGVSVW